LRVHPFLQYAIEAVNGYMYTHATSTNGWTSSSAVSCFSEHGIAIHNKTCPITLSLGASYCALAATNLTLLSQYCACLHDYLIVCDHNLSQGYGSHTHIYTHILVYTYMHTNAHTFTHRHQQELEGLRSSVAMRVLERKKVLRWSTNGQHATSTKGWTSSSAVRHAFQSI
jgi:hypothetical protein